MLPLQRLTKRISAVPHEITRHFDHEGEWLWNDALQRRCRHVKFNVDALCNISTSVVGAQKCVRFESFAQGAYNKLFLLGFDNGAEAIARISSPLVGNLHMSTASEVATMEYVREVFGEPTPRVLAWSRTPKLRAAVESDFILMERVHGVSLEDRWLNTFDADMGALLKDLISFDIHLHGRFFSQIGSLFFKEDVSPELRDRPLYLKEEHNTEPAAQKYRIGPVVDKQYWFNEYVEGDRGPWLDMTSFIQTTCRLAHCKAESQAASASSSHPRPSSLLSRSKPHDLPELRRLLQQCISLAPYLNPSEPALTAPRLTHPDLSRSNILVAPTGAANVQSYIDWQGAMTLPYIQGAIISPAVLYGGNLIPLPDDPFSMPAMPPDTDISPELQEQANLELRLAKRHQLTSSVLLRRAPLCLATACVPHAQLLASLPETALRCYADGPQNLRHLVRQLCDAWPFDMDEAAECPIQLSSEDITRDEEDYPAFVRYQQRKDEYRGHIQCDPDGRMPEEHVDAMRRNWVVARQKWNEEEVSPFPFQDGMWSFHLT
ncbi:kinase-like domain-containing protein [Desarmillaria tabescens]|uniref:Altered inheritance of mitochondria protein 9, mitochondrial n=1 Tax=Armillaria tabescens TaxID=1929756 RepID=A0AA39N7M6_ARMTA|nr:kinase-like domain-containing protein [Desarmillaria tabescens]KAK0460523.1 kinase-like domain-containing protein [Desarmillaria tabescens]